MSVRPSPHRSARFVPTLLAFAAVIAAGPAMAQWPPDGVPIGEPPWLDIAALAPDGSGGVYATWAATPSGQAPGLFGARVHANGSYAPGWPATGLRLRDLPSSARFALAASDGEDGLLAAWFNPFLGQSNPLLTLARHQPDGALSPGWPGAGTSVWDEPYAITPLMIPDGKHGALFAWFVRTNPANDPDFLSARVDLRAMRVESGGDRASGWPEDGRLLHATPETAPRSRIYDFRITRSEAHGLFVARCDSSDGIGDLYVHHVDANGIDVAGWPTDGRPVCSVSSRKQIAGLAGDGAGGVFVVWTEPRDGTPGAFVMRLDAHGAPAAGWPAAGLRVTDASEPAFAMDAEADGAGGILLLLDVGSVGTLHYQLARLRADGSTAPGWPAGGVRVEEESNLGEGAEVVADATGGGYVVWLEPASSSIPFTFNLRITRVDGFGAIAAGWPAEGRVVAIRAEQRIRVLADERGGAIVGWKQTGPGPSEMRVQRYGPDGNPTTDVDTRASGAGLMPAWPNPFRSTVQLAFTLPAPTTAVVEVVDVTGRRVRALAAGPLDAGEHRLWWDGRDDEGRLQRPGLYWVRARWPGFEASRKVVRTF